MKEYLIIDGQGDEESAVCDTHSEKKTLLGLIESTDWEDEEVEAISEMKIGECLSFGDILVERLK